MRDLAGKVAVITGAGSGLGRCMAIALAEQGVDVVIADIELAPAERVAGEVKALGRRGLAVRTDVSDAASVKALADHAYDKFGRVDILINNAGVCPVPMRAVWDFEEIDFRWVVDVNLFGVIHGVSTFVPRMMKQDGWKQIVNTSSLTTFVKSPGLSGYVASKMAVTGFTDTIREELAPHGIGVTLLLPGLTNTRIMEAERNRPVEEQTVTRNLPEYSDYEVTGERNEQIAGAVKFEDASGISEMLEPEIVGPVIVRAIRENLDYCLTHPAPAEAIRKMAETLIGAPSARSN